MKATTGSDTVYYTRGFELISKRDGSAASCFIYDGGLSVRALTNEAGTVTDTLVFDAFGNETVKTGSTDNAYGFQGEEKDETGLYYLRARYMDPSTGTFTSMDTYGGSLSDPMSLHKYMFANSNPVMYSDPSGHFSLVEFELSEAIDQILMSSLNYAIAYAGIIQNSNTSLSDNEKLAGYFAAMGVGLLMPFVFSAIALLPFVGALLVTLVLAIALGVGSYFAGKNGHEREAVILGIASGDCVGNAIGLSINRVVQWLNESNLVQAEAKRRNGSWYKADGSKNYPPDLGAIPETETEITLREGDIIGRYGEIRYNSDFVTEGGVNPDKLSLPPWTSPTDYQEFMVTGDIPSVIRSVISPWGDSFGLGLQYKLPIPIKELIEKGLLVPF